MNYSNRIQKLLGRSVCFIDGTLTGNISLCQSEPGSNVQKELFHPPQISRTGASPLDPLESYPGHPFRGSYPLQQIESMQSKTWRQCFHNFWWVICYMYICVYASGYFYQFITISKWNGWDYRIRRRHLCRGVRPPPTPSILDMALNHLILQFCSFVECGVLHCYDSQVHSDPEHKYLLGSQLWVK